MTGNKIDALDFRQIKRWLRFHSITKVARRFSLHESTVLAIRGSKTYNEYREQVKAKHPPIKNSLADEIMDLHYNVLYVPGYIPPRNATVAIKELKKVLTQGD